jgi:rod shape-determining protein MreD
LSLKMHGRYPGVVLPALTLVGAIVLDLLPLPNAAPLASAPPLLIAVFYFWTVHRPDLLPPLALFVLGGLLDAVGGLPVGVTSLALLLARALLLSAQRWLHQQPWPVAWACFLPAAFMVAGLRWGLVSLVLGRVFPLSPVMLEAGLSFLAYPIVAGPLALVQRRAMAATRAAAGG